MRTIIAVSCLLLTPFLTIASPTMILGDEAEVIVSGANVFPVAYEPIQETDCKSLILPGTYKFFRYPSDGHGGSGPGVLVSTVEIGRLLGNRGVFPATEAKLSVSLPGFLQTPYIQLWQFNGCTLIFAQGPDKPLFVGSHTSISDPSHIFFYGFGGNSSELRRL
jgi:hypothetical protein